MKRRTKFLLVSSLMLMTVDSAYSATTATKVYVDKQDKQLLSNQVWLRDMLNTKDDAGNWATLETEALTAIPAINELHAEMADKQDVINAENPLSVENVSGLAPVAVSGSYEDLTDKPEMPSMENLAEKSYVDTELGKKAEATIVQALQEDITNNYLTKTQVQNTYLTQQDAADTYVTTQQVAEQITNVVGTDTSGLKKQVADNTVAIAGKANSADVYSKGEADSKFLMMQDSNALGANLQWDENGKLNTKGIATADGLQELEDKVADAVTESELTAKGYQTASDVQGAITTATADLATKSELGNYAKVDSLKALAYKDTVSTADIDNDAVTVAKIEPAAPVAGEKMFMAVGEDGKTTWLSVKIY